MSEDSAAEREFHDLVKKHITGMMKCKGVLSPAAYYTVRSERLQDKIAAIESEQYIHPHLTNEPSAWLREQLLGETRCRQAFVWEKLSRLQPSQLEQSALTEAFNTMYVTEFKIGDLVLVDGRGFYQIGVVEKMDEEHVTAMDIPVEADGSNLLCVMEALDPPEHVYKIGHMDPVAVYSLGHLNAAGFSYSAHTVNGAFQHLKVVWTDNLQISPTKRGLPKVLSYEPNHFFSGFRAVPLRMKERDWSKKGNGRNGGPYR